MIERNQFYRQTNQKRRDLATAQTVRKDGYIVELPATCFKKATGLMKGSVLKDVVGHWNKERVDRLVNKYGARIIAEKESA